MEPEKNRMIFLGTGGGKHVMSSQIRKTGGIYFNIDGLKFIIDPGTGSFIHAISLGLEPQKWDGVLLSHMHPDHSTDVNVYLDCMISGLDITPANEKAEIERIKSHRDKIKTPFLLTNESCLKPTERFYPCVTKYHQEISRVIVLKHGKGVKIGDVKIIASECDHYAPTIGFRIEGSRKIGYVSDGTYFRGQEKYFEGCDILILNVLVPKGKDSHKGWHMNVDEAIMLLNSMKEKPKFVILSHLSLSMLRSNVFKQCRIIYDATKIRAIPAEDFMEIELDNNDYNKHRILRVLQI